MLLVFLNQLSERLYAEPKCERDLRDAPQSGRPPKVTTPIWQKIDMRADDHPHVSLERLSHLANCGTGKDTLNQTSHNLGYKTSGAMNKTISYTTTKTKTTCMVFKILVLAVGALETRVWNG